MQAFRTENNYRNASRLSAAELRAAMASREILQSTALAFDTQRQLRFELGGCRAVMPFGQCADGADQEVAAKLSGGQVECIPDTRDARQPREDQQSAQRKRAEQQQAGTIKTVFGDGEPEQDRTPGIGVIRRLPIRGLRSRALADSQQRASKAGRGFGDVSIPALKAAPVKPARQLMDDRFLACAEIRYS